MLRVCVLIATAISVSALTVVAEPADTSAGRSLMGYLGLGLHSARYSPAVVLGNPRVREELKVSAVQAARLKSVEEERQRANVRFYEEKWAKEKELREASDPEALAEFRESAQAAHAAFSGETETSLLKVLDRSQRTRLLQIQYQAEGPKAFTRPEVQERLNLSPEQIEQILAIVSQGDVELRQAILAPEDLPKDIRADIEKRRAQLESKPFQDAIKNAEGAASKVRTSIMRDIAKVLTKGQ